MCVCVCLLCLWPLTLCVSNNRVELRCVDLWEILFPNTEDCVCVHVSMFSGLTDKNASVDFRFTASCELSLCRPKLN